MKISITGARGFLLPVRSSPDLRAVMWTSRCDLSESKAPEITILDIRSPDLGDLIPEGADAVHLAALSREAECKGRLDDWFDINVAAASMFFMRRIAGV